MLVASGITKRFGRVVALDRVDFRARAGEIHALVGENGAGKSTLISIFAGRLSPDAGGITLDGAMLRAGSPAAALAAGVAAVYQSPMLFERMSWEENLALGGFRGAARRLNLSAVAEKAYALARDLGFELPPSGVTIEERSVTDRVRLEIIRALSFNPRVLILDEPTGVLAPDERAAFLHLLRRLRAEGRIVVIVTHKLGEALAVSDRVTVLRAGRVVAETSAGATSEAELARLMIGQLGTSAPRGTEHRAAGEIALALADATLIRDGRRVLDGVTFELRTGEIAGIAGVDGNGQSELVEILAGVRAPSSGAVRSFGAADAGAMVIIPQDRDFDGLILDMELWENLMLAHPLRRRFSRLSGWLARKSAMTFCGELLERFRIHASAGPETAAGALSGGNRQRLAVGRALACAPRVLVAHDVCRGLDLRATAEIHHMLREFAIAGGAVLLISSDLDELLGLCGRLSVMSRGRLIETTADERDPGRLGLLMAGAVG